MSKALTENQVLEMLNIPDFRHMSKDKVMTFMSMIPDMDPDVAIDAINQFPKFAEMSKEIVANCRQVVKEGLDANDKNGQQFYAACNKIIDALDKLLKKENLSFEERQYIIEQMTNLANIMYDKDSENKAFIKQIVGGACVGAIIVAGSAAAILGGRVDINLPQLLAKALPK